MREKILSKYTHRSYCIFSMKFHLILVTKYRNKCLTDEIPNSLENFIKILSAKWKVDVEEINGESDHVHLLISTEPSLTLSKFIENLKAVTSRRLHENYSQHFKKYYWGTNSIWSRSYCLISVGGAPLEILREYINTQQRPE